jgi:hypothetical protein
MLALSAARVNACNAYYYRKLGLTPAVFARSHAVLAKALRGRHLTRPELASVLRQARVVGNDSLAVTYLAMRAELDGVICSGARRGKQHTYALLDERAGPAKTLDHDEALAELTRRYFTSHGPATLKDYVWWSGLTTADAKTGLEMIKSALVHETVDGRTFWLSASTSWRRDTRSASGAHLLPNFDEYIVAYADGRAVYDGPHSNHSNAGVRGSSLLNNTIVVDGEIVGTWKRTLERRAVTVKTKLFRRLTTTETAGLARAADSYGVFLELIHKHE